MLLSYSWLHGVSALALCAFIEIAEAASMKLSFEQSRAATVATFFNLVLLFIMVLCMATKGVRNHSERRYDTVMKSNLRHFPLDE